MSTNTKPLSVFIIEDDPDDQVLLQLAFDAGPVPVTLTFVNDCHQALARLQACDPADVPDIIVSDYNTPLMNGEEFLGKLKLESRFDRIPRVILSTAASPSAIENCLANGAARYIVKPFSFDDLVGVAAEITALHQPDVVTRAL